MVRWNVTEESESAGSTKTDVRARVLCLGNDLLADDGFALAVADELSGRENYGLEIVCSIESGFSLIDYLIGVDRVVVVDTLMDPAGVPGTVDVFTEDDVEVAFGGSPHYTGLFEALALGRRLGLPVAAEVMIVAVRAADCLTIGGSISPSLMEKVPAVTSMVARLATAHFSNTAPDRVS